MEEKVRYYFIFTGRVQGVGFRWIVMNYANRNSLTGWIRNLYNGNVEMEIQGNETAIMNMIGEVTKKSYYLVIEDYSMKQIPLEENEYGFDVRM